LNNRVFAIAVPIVWTAIVFFLHVMPVRLDHESSISIPNADKVVHFGMFGILAFLLARSWEFFKVKISRRQVYLIILICASYGALLEYLQHIGNAKRDSDVFDWIADLVGTSAGLYMASTKILPLFFRHQIGKTP
jgi:VanZ family protein